MSLHLCGDYKHIIVSFATPYGIAYRKHVDHIIPSAGRPQVQRAVTVLLSGMCLFDAVWLLSFGSLLWLGSVLLWAGTRLLQKLGCRAT